MQYTAKVKDVLTTGFAEVEILDEDYTGERRCIAWFSKKNKAHRDDIVALEPLGSRTVNEAKIAYILPIAAFALGYVITKTLSTGERILSGAILAVMAFVVAWLMNRRSRLLKRQSFMITEILQEDPNHL